VRTAVSLIPWFAAGAAGGALLKLGAEWLTCRRDEAAREAAYRDQVARVLAAAQTITVLAARERGMP
jgi:hypothetical protein